MEFLICRTDGDWFDLPLEQWPRVLHPTSFDYQRTTGFGEYCIEIDKCIVEINYEMPGIQVLFHGEIEWERANQITGEILENISSFTGQSGEVIDLNNELAGKVIRFE